MGAPKWSYLSRFGNVTDSQLDDLGNQGWELVAVVGPLLTQIPITEGVVVGSARVQQLPVVYGSDIRFIFKQPK